ncbi:hypothetical protein ACF0H5_021862 [Mactra antiquata]
MLMHTCVILIGACVLLTQLDMLEATHCVNIQTCLNCAPPLSRCPTLLGSKTGVVNGSVCREECNVDLAGSCDFAHYVGAYQECNYYDCSSGTGIEINYESEVYRRTCNYDCERFEVQSIGSSGIDSSCLMSTELKTSYIDCFELCLDTELCRATIYQTDTGACSVYNCQTLSTSIANAVTLVKICRPLPPPYEQVCVNCVAGPKCSTPMYTASGVKTSDSCSATCNGDDDCSMFVYSRTTEECKFYFCNQVGYDYMAGSVAVRKTYNSDCLRYELVRMMGYRGVAAELEYMSSLGLLENTCLELCLATENCIAVSWALTSCFLLSGHTVIEAPGFVHYKRHCIDGTACSSSMQTCLNCDRSSYCQENYNTVQVSVSNECNDACMSDDRCETAVFNSSSNNCNLYQCPRLSYFHFNYGANVNFYSTNTVYRKSCKADCPVFRLQSKAFHNGSCPIIGEEIGDVDEDYCVNRCLDMATCRAVTYSSLANEVPCLYHSCDSHTDAGIASGKTFIYQTCDPDCDRTTIQTCTNCGLGEGCSAIYHAITSMVHSQDCSAACSSNNTCNLGIFNTSGNTCLFSECLKVDYNVYSKAFRSSCSSGCPIYSIHKKYRYLAVDVMETHTNIWSEQECLAICLDNDTCRSAVYLYDNSNCFLQSDTQSTYASSLNTVFYERNCDAGVGSVEDCFTSPYWMSAIASSIHYDPSTGTCMFYECVGVEEEQSFDVHRLIRKTCLNECPDISIETLVGYYGYCDNVTDKSFDIEIEQQICLEYCLDTSTCRGVNFDISTNTCYYVTDMCDDANPTIADPNWTYIKVECMNMTVKQICNNCDISACPSSYTQSVVGSSSECKTNCEQSSSCMTSLYDKTTKQCSLYECSTIDQAVTNNNRLFRRSSNTDCTQYELYKNDGYTGSCQVMSTINDVYYYQHCIEECLDTPSCRGISYDSSTSICSLHNATCSTLVSNTNSIYIIKYCTPDCITPNIQRCENCRSADTCTTIVDQSFNNITQPYNIDTSILQSDNDVIQMWYNGSTMQYTYMNCPDVQRNSAGYNIVYRRSCSSDCLNYEVYTLPGYRGICNTIDYLSGGVTEDICRSKCIDMVGCRAVTFDFSTTLTRCVFHDCDNYTMGSNSNFMRKRCIEDCYTPVTTTCVGCNPTSSCNYYTNTTDVTLESYCIDLDNNDTDNTMTLFSRDDHACLQSQCPFLNRNNYNMVYRATCNTDCIRYEIFEILNYIGTCTVIGEDEGLDLNFEQCVARCLHMSGCWAMTIHHSSVNRCEYHSCTSFTSSTVDSPAFFYKRCLDDEPARDNPQICVGCSHSHLCQWYNIALLGKTHDECEELFTEDDSNSYLYHMDTTYCLITDCHWVTQDIGMNDIAYRKSTTTDCSIYRVHRLYNKFGSCSILEEDYGVYLDYCTNRCLDLDGCRAMTYEQSTQKCSYHNCIGYNDVVDNTIFTWRECMTASEYLPVKNYTQIIEDGRSDCGESWNKDLAIMRTTNNVDVASHCTCSVTGCNNVIYNLSDRKCREYECDRPAPSGFGKTLYRKTFNPDCLSLYMQVLTFSVPGCTEYRIEEGFSPGSYCVQLCLDDPLCNAVGVHSTQLMCAFYSCDGSYTTGDMSYLIVKHCIPDTLSNCLSSLNTDTDCKGIKYNTTSSLCTQYQCGRVQQQYNNTFYRRSCSSDCPVYEMYTVQGIGTCTLFPDMTEELVSDSSVCFERCLKTDECRGVTYIGQTCQYHHCDCYNSTVGGETFMWRYCLNDVSEKTDLYDPSDTNFYPTECLSTTSVAMTSSTAGTTTDPTSSTAGTTTPISTTEADTTTDATSSTAGTTAPISTTEADTTTDATSSTAGTTTPTTSPAATTTVTTSSTAGTTTPTTSSATTTAVVTSSTTSSPTTPIFISPCLCSTGLFSNLTQEEIIAVLEKESLIDAETTSKHFRKLNSVPDDRTSAVSIGFAGTIILSTVVFIMMALDFGTLVKGIRNKTCKKNTPDNSTRQNNKQ